MKIIFKNKEQALLEKRDFMYLCCRTKTPGALNKYLYLMNKLDDSDFFLIRDKKIVEYLESVEEVFDYKDYFYLQSLPLNKRLSYFSKHFDYDLLKSDYYSNLDVSKKRYILGNVQEFIKGDRRINLDSLKEYSSTSNEKYELNDSLNGILEFKRKDGGLLTPDEELTEVVKENIALTLAREDNHSTYQVNYLKEGNSLYVIFNNGNKKTKTLTKK